MLVGTGLVPVRFFTTETQRRKRVAPFSKRHKSKTQRHKDAKPQSYSLFVILVKAGIQFHISFHHRDSEGKESSAFLQMA